MNQINVTKPSLPDIKEVKKILDELWQSRWLTNNGKFHQEFEKKLADFLGTEHLALCANGTLALVIALQALRITGEVITTPYSFVATTHSLHWNGIKPVFVDTEKNSFNLDPNKIEASITPRTTAVLPVHVYGYPCNVDEIQRIADIYGLKIIYDAAHAFNVRLNGIPIVNFGDMTILSFHSTKIFHTFEGGAIICKDEKTKQRIDFLKNFGFADEVTVVGPGINAKMNEFQAGLGLLQLKEFDQNKEKRRQLFFRYCDMLKNIKGINFFQPLEGLDYNYAYFPILVNEDKYGMSRDDLYQKLKDIGIYARRYFYPLISNFPTYRGLESTQSSNLINATQKSEQVLCIPLYSELAFDEQDRVIKVITNK
ncbi:MAG: DegT/DnrJ/EryC1/StrS family aminotransferase [Bacteroidales bacterium]|nr:DegT/DnrJ/EryC1/StrS family aminotransferase [Bacteroidales bacterium]